MFKLIIMLTTLDPTSAAFIPHSYYSSMNACIGAREYKVKAIKDYVLYDLSQDDYMITAECFEVGDDSN